MLNFELEVSHTDIKELKSFINKVIKNNCTLLLSNCSVIVCELLQCYNYIIDIVSIKDGVATAYINEVKIKFDRLIIGGIKE